MQHQTSKLKMNDEMMGDNGQCKDPSIFTMLPFFTSTSSSQSQENIHSSSATDDLAVSGNITSSIGAATAGDKTFNEAPYSKAPDVLSDHGHTELLTDVTLEDSDPSYDNLADGIPNTNGVINHANDETRVRSFNRIFCFL